jgi:hypothetical protein
LDFQQKFVPYPGSVDVVVGVHDAVLHTDNASKLPNSRQQTFGVIRTHFFLESNPDTFDSIGHVFLSGF